MSYDTLLRLPLYLFPIVRIQVYIDSLYLVSTILHKLALVTSLRYVRLAARE